VSDAAANTVMSPDTGTVVEAADVEAAEDDGAPVIAAAPVVAADDPPSSPHATARNPNSTRRTRGNDWEPRMAADRTRLIVSN
jgi:hypothetical protein